LDLLLRREERNAVPAAVKEHRDGYRDEWAQEAKCQDRDPLRGGGNRWAIAWLDAWGAAHPDVVADEHRLERSAGDAEKSAGRAPGVRARDEGERRSAEPGVAAEAAEPCTPAAGRSGEQ